MALKPEYLLDKTAIQHEGRRISMTTYADISPEIVLMLKLKLHIDGIRNDVGIVSHPTPSTWRKRLAHVTEN
jgi:hypothetical protein